MNKNNSEEVIGDDDVNGSIVVVLDNKKSIKTGIQLQAYTDIQGMIYQIRGQQVMLDSDLAKIYGYELKKMNQQVKRNMVRFPEDFMFQLTEREMIELSRSQKVTSIQTVGIKGGRTYKIYAFTEHGVNQLSAVLKSPIAVKQSVLIIRTFVKMRHYIATNRQLLEGVLKSRVPTYRTNKWQIDIVKIRNDIHITTSYFKKLAIII